MNIKINILQRYETFAEHFRGTLCGAGGALIYFGGKAIFEYSSGQTLFTKPTK